jgi:ribonuclease P protein component
MPGLARSITLFSSAQIKTLFKKARTQFKNLGLEIRLAPREFDFGRILIVIPRSAGNAPERNRIRRRLKAIFYEEHLFEKEFDWIVLVSKQAIPLSFSQIKEILLSVLKKA